MPGNKSTEWSQEVVWIALPMRYVAAKMQILRAWESAFQLWIMTLAQIP